MRLFKSQEEKQQIHAARSDYEELVHAVATAAPERAQDLASSFALKPELMSLPEKERERLGAAVFRAYAENVLADDHFTVDEQTAMGAVMSALGFDKAKVNTTFRDVAKRVTVAAANDGRLPVLPTAHLISKKSEFIHWEDGANLMKEVVLREFVGGYSGFSFPIAKGVRYRTGSARGHSVVVGTQMQIEDNGYLTVTSQRVAYMGARKSMEIPYAKLMSMDVFTDGIRFHASNRQTAPLFQIEQGTGDVVAAIVNAAIKRFNE
jgi:hypothetical protein